jgi:hypothetical protein
MHWRNQQPDIAAVILRMIGFEQSDLHFTRLRLQKLSGLGRLDESMSSEGPAGRLVTCTDPQRQLIDHIRSSEIGDSPTLARSVPSDQPARHHEFDGECVRLDFLEIASRLRLKRHSPQDAFVIKTRLVSQAKVAEFVSRGEPLYAHGALRGNEDAGPRIAQICAKKPLKRTHE